MERPKLRKQVGRDRFFLQSYSLICLALGLLASGSTYALGIKSSNFCVQPGSTHKLQFVIDGNVATPALEPVTNDLFSVGVKVTFDPAKVAVNSVTVAPALDYFGFGAGAQVVFGVDFVGIKGNVDLTAPSFYSGNLLMTLEITDLGGETPFTLTPSLYQPLGPSEQVIIDGLGTVLDGTVVFQQVDICQTSNSADMPAASEDLVVHWTMVDSESDGEYDDAAGTPETIVSRGGSAPTPGGDDIVGDYLYFAENADVSDGIATILDDTPGPYLYGTLDFLRTGSFTITGWARADEAGVPIINIGDSFATGANQFITVFVNPQLQLVAGIRGPNQSTDTVIVSSEFGDIVPGEWFYYEFSRSVGVGTSLILNGEVVDASLQGATFAIDPVSNSRLVLGGAANNANSGTDFPDIGYLHNWLRGALGETFIWNDALSAQESEAAYAYMLDRDQDGILDSIETYATDSDGDGIPDYADLDSDNDGLRDDEEDLNGNGVVDAGETDPTRQDTDGDLLLDREERNIWGTNPQKLDTDGDGTDDGIEVLDGTNPLLSSCDLDDTDGLSIGDLLLVNQQVLGAGSLTPTQELSCDVNDDGVLSISDLFLLQQAYLNP